MKRLRSSLRLLGGAAALLLLPLATPAHAQFVPVPSCDEVQIIGTPVVSGTGCPSGSAHVVVASTTPGCRTADFLEVLFDNFTAEKGPGVAFAKRRQQCTVEVTLRIPSGIRFTMASVHYEGFADIQGSASSASLTSDYFIPIPPNVVHATTTKTLYGPFTGNFGKDDTLAFLTEVWPPRCNIQVPANLRSILQVNGPTSSHALITVDQVSGKLHQVWGFKWAACP